MGEQSGSEYGPHLDDLFHDNPEYKGSMAGLWEVSNGDPRLYERLLVEYGFAVEADDGRGSIESQSHVVDGAILHFDRPITLTASDINQIGNYLKTLRRRVENSR